MSLRQLSVACRASNSAVNGWIDKWPDFPVLKIGGPGKPNLYSVAAVTEFLTAKRAELFRERPLTAGVLPA